MCRSGTTLNVPKSVTRTSTAFTAVIGPFPELLPLGSATTAPPTVDELIVPFTTPPHKIVSGVPPKFHMRSATLLTKAMVMAVSAPPVPASVVPSGPAAPAPLLVKPRPLEAATTFDVAFTVVPIQVEKQAVFLAAPEEPAALTVPSSSINSISRFISLARLAS